MAHGAMLKEIAKATRITKKIETTEAALKDLYAQRRGLSKDQWFVWCRVCGRNETPGADGVETCPSCRKGR